MKMTGLNHHTRNNHCGEGDRYESQHLEGIPTGSFANQACDTRYDHSTSSRPYKSSKILHTLDGILMLCCVDEIAVSQCLMTPVNRTYAGGYEFASLSFALRDCLRTRASSRDSSARSLSRSQASS